jgi:hypothetical protein
LWDAAIPNISRRIAQFITPGDNNVVRDYSIVFDAFAAACVFACFSASIVEVARALTDAEAALFFRTLFYAYFFIRHSAPQICGPHARFFTVGEIPSIKCAFLRT